eukprot:CAMPEP_0170746672 /NCGR_PEP_ID=MMETSP0437-20130122/8928_1 /TAXON_ID=0 /ORGANISM="Sexangularia sp." /LENGTH=689 /DNA_ID=CAMNT_0011085427 /DNA_START=219 /DNA_END=2288 /DNA_ORIENTATION=-
MPGQLALILVVGEPAADDGSSNSMSPHGLTPPSSSSSHPNSFSSLASLTTSGLADALLFPPDDDHPSSDVYLCWTPHAVLDGSLTPSLAEPHTLGLRIPIGDIVSLFHIQPPLPSTEAPHLIARLSTHPEPLPAFFFEKGGVGSLLKWLAKEISVTRGMAPGEYCVSADRSVPGALLDSSTLPDAAPNASAAHRPTTTGQRRAQSGSASAIGEQLVFSVLNAFSGVTRMVSEPRHGRRRSADVGAVVRMDDDPDEEPPTDATVTTRVPSQYLVTVPYAQEKAEFAEYLAKHRARVRERGTTTMVEGDWEFVAVSADSPVPASPVRDSVVNSAALLDSSVNARWLRIDEMNRRDVLAKFENTDPVTEDIVRAKLASVEGLPRAEQRQVRDELVAQVHYGGVEPGSRRYLWRLLCHYEPWFATDDGGRDSVLAKRAAEFEVYRTQWQSVTPEQERHCTNIVDQRHRIDKDVVRTDRSNPFYANEEDGNIDGLRQVLRTYCTYNQDVGYVQGMNDILAPILAVQDGNLCDAFWCFKGVMDVFAANFHSDQNGMSNSLRLLRDLVEKLDPALFAFLERKEATNMFFAYRWMLLLLKREFSYDDLVRLWDTLFANAKLIDKFHYFVALAIIEEHRDHIMDSDMAFDDLLKYVNDLSGTIDVKKTLVEAEVLFLRFINLSGTEDISRDLFARVMG